MITYAVAVLVLLPVLALVVGAARGRVRVRPCCPADPARDLRMRAAFTEQRDDR